MDTTTDEIPRHVSRTDDGWQVTVDLHALPVPPRAVSVDVVGDEAIVAVDGPTPRAFDLQLPGDDPTVHRNNGVLTVAGGE